jgi:pyridoxine 4-dehydrogenase
MSESPATGADTLTIGSDLVVNRLGYGAMRLTGRGMWGSIPTVRAV